ncbi:hypothetical protein LXL04_002685 [Taraxacum kok-saghyz]
MVNGLYHLLSTHHHHLPSPPRPPNAIIVKDGFKAAVEVYIGETTVTNTFIPFINFIDCPSPSMSEKHEASRNDLVMLQWGMLRLQMGVVLMFGGQMPLIKVGRTAGQFAKHRSIPFEEKKGVKLPSYRGDNAEGKPKLHSGEDKDVQPTLLITCDQHVGILSSIFVTNLNTGSNKVDYDKVEIYFHEIPEDDVDKLNDEGLLLRVAGALIIEHPLIVPYVKKLGQLIDSVMGLPKALTEKLLKEAMKA